ncbi:MAG: PilZ domain-containing protein [Thermodesulfobacteriota bacterium]|nr:PilZ domain-containing protein [Thermodesulfobacteriota bacterium]
MESKDKRKHFRVNSLNLSYVFVDGKNDEGSQTIGRTLNVSESGILLETRIPVHLNDRLLLTIGLKEDLVNINGKVVHAAEDEDGKYEVGVQFTDKDDTASEILQKYIKAFKDKKKSD